MRLIDADELVVDMRIDYNDFPSNPIYGTMQSTYGVTIQQIESAPTIEVVRCKDCNKWDDGTLQVDGANHKCWGGCKLWGYQTDASDFCSYGARKTEPQIFDKPPKCLGCVYSELDKSFHPCASCVNFSKYVGERSE